MYMDIRGLVSGEGKAHQFPLSQLYVPLKTSHVKAESDSPGLMKNEVPLEKALNMQHILIKGEPGAGKTTFLRLIVFSLCQKLLGHDVKEMKTKIQFPWQPRLPVFVPLGQLINFIYECMRKDHVQSPLAEDSPDWLLYFLDSQSRQFTWGVGKEDFHNQLVSGNCLILLDGLDEAPNQEVREQVSSLASNLVTAFPQCHVIMTSRPQVLSGKSVPPEYTIIEILPLDESAIEAFLEQWSSALYQKAPEESVNYQEELKKALTARPEIRRMARTPVMLTALAVVHWNENRLPEQRAELYESIVNWLLKAREKREGRLKTFRCRQLLQKLALNMFTRPEGRQRQVGLRWAAEALESEFTITQHHTALMQAEYFLRDEMIDSGIIVERNNFIEFWHLTFQEYLTAYEISGKSEKDQIETIFDNDRLYMSEWREVMLLLSGVLYKSGIDKVNNLITTIIDKEVEETNLSLLARKVGLLGGMVNDLSPFDFQPSDKRYKSIVRSVMGIFEKETFRSTSVRIRIEAADALGRVGDPRFDKEEDLWVPVPAGTFWMGAQRYDPKGQDYDSEASDEEFPVHEVEYATYCIGKYPVTVCQYKQFIEAGGYKDKKYWQAGGFGEFDKPDKWEDQLQYPTRPVVYVSWFEAKAYVKWKGCRLPTEAEWERTAHGPGEEYRKYPWGNEEPDEESLNFGDNIGHATPVGIFPDSCSPEGVIDMAGNVWEWCEDWYSEYHSKPVVDPNGSDRGDISVLRGGSWRHGDWGCRSALRIYDSPVLRFDDCGFRLARGQN
jgi:formylglycine-generating enzyme required for sulfatase activity/DNA polymerase III delta prime subunit